MSSSVQDFVIERIEAAPIQRLPSSHFHIDGVFPAISMPNYWRTSLSRRIMSAWPIPGA
ncbi:MAG: hypothetical protein QGF53_14470 [Alphaproteobacteria bacterium]|jgi:hypothetical protein|nr:hypothetical protein [Alphaproteobacteria bacterium]